MSIAGEDRADHRDIALASRIGAQLIDAGPAAFDLGGAFAFVGEGSENESIDPIRRFLRKSAGADRAGRLAEHMNLGAAGFALNDLERRGEIFDPLAMSELPDVCEERP